MIVMKFGGTSVKDANAMKKVLKIVRQKIDDKPIVVLSACSGITNELVFLADHSILNSNKENTAIINSINQLHIDIANNLFRNNKDKEIAIKTINELIDELHLFINGVKLLKECTPRSKAKILSYGELLSSSIFNLFCQANKIDSELLYVQKILKTDNNFLEARPNLSKINRIAHNYIKKKFNNNDVLITQGFIGANDFGLTTLLGRGGSDYSAAILGASVNAEEIQIWTDVDGVLTADPRLIKNSRTIKEMTFAEVRELSFFGAKVLHSETIIPAVEKNIPVRILNTFNPKNTGTVIIEKQNSNLSVLRSAVLKEDCTFSTIQIPTDISLTEFYTYILNQIKINNYKLLLSSYLDGICQFVFDNNANPKLNPKIFPKYSCQNITADLICVSGNNLNYQGKGYKKIINTVSEIISQYSPHLLLFGTSSVSIQILLPKSNSKKALNDIHKLIK